MSGPVTAADTPSEADARDVPVAACVEVTESRKSQVGALPVRRALPRRGRRTVGAWCFIDHMGPADLDEAHGLDVGPHPHIGLQTVTWLLEGEAVHRDSLGTEQIIAAGQLNLMTAGRGVAHSEEGTGRYRGRLQGLQLWIAQPPATREDAPGFEHHEALPEVELDGGIATVLIGQLGDAASPARRDTDHGGFDLDLRAGLTTLPLQPEYEHALVVATGAAEVDGQVIEPGHLGYLGMGRDELRISTHAATRAVLLGGVPFEEPVLMWWNFVARTQAEITDAHADWTAGGGRFGSVASSLPRLEVGPPPWTRS